MYRALLISLNKFLTLMCHLFKKNGSVYPGSITFNLNRKILTKIKYPKYVIGVTGSSGKGTTTSLIANVLKKNHYKIVYNDSGSNGVRALTTLILNNCNIFGKLKADVLLLEIDERHIHMAFPNNILTHLIVTNITRDQPARNGHVDIIYDYIFKSITNYTTLIINADDPVVNAISLKHRGKVIKYGINKTIDSFTKPVINNLDHAYCPKCHQKLIYDFYHYGQMGTYHCSNCEFGRNPVNYEITEVNLSDSNVVIDNTPIHIAKDALYTAYSTIAAYALLKEINVSHEKIVNVLNDKTLKSKRGNIYHYHNNPFIMLESKNENALSYYQSLKYINSNKGKKMVILGFDNVSRRYKYNDLSWLYDVEFELLNNKNIDKILVIGRFRYDVLNRLLYANIEKEKIILINDLNEIKEILNNVEETIYTMVCFDMTYNLKEILKEDLHD